MFITFEGIEGSGKSTHARLITEYLREQGHEVFLTREPGWGKASKVIRKLMVEEKKDRIHPLTELLLFCADRIEHVQNFIKPRLDNGKYVVCDRYFDSTIAYQGYGRKLDIDLVKKLAEDSTLNVKPDVTFLMDLPVAEGLERLKSRAEKTSRFDDEPTAFYESVRNGYMSEAHLNTERIRIVDVLGKITGIQNHLRNIIENEFLA